MAEIKPEHCLEGYDVQGNVVYTPMFVICSGCDGTGEQEGEPEPCSLCGYHGKVRPDCPECHGHGMKAPRQIRCNDCNGEGVVPEDHNVELIVKALNAGGFYSAHPGLTRIG